MMIRIERKNIQILYNIEVKVGYNGYEETSRQNKIYH